MSNISNNNNTNTSNAQHEQQGVGRAHPYEFPFAHVLFYNAGTGVVDHQVEGEDQNNNNNPVVQGHGNNVLPDDLRREASNVIRFIPSELNYRSSTCIGVPTNPNTVSSTCITEVIAGQTDVNGYVASVETTIYSNQFGSLLCTRCAARLPNAFLERYRWNFSRTETINYGTVEDVAADGKRRDAKLRSDMEATKAKRRLQREVKKQLKLHGTSKYYVTVTCTTEEGNRLVKTLVGEVRSVQLGLVEVNTHSGRYTYTVQQFYDLMHNRDTPAVREVFCNGVLFAWKADA